MMNTKFCLPLLVGIFLFPWALQAQNKLTTVSELENYFRIQDEVLINFQGERYPKIAFEDPLHENLAYLLKDPEQALVIHQAYARHIRPHLPEECRKPFSNALAKVCFLFGSEKFSPENSLLAALKEESPSRSAPLQKFLEQFRSQSRSNRRSQVDSYCINTDQLAKPAVVDLSELSRPKLSQEFLQGGTREWTDLHRELISLFVNEANRPARPNPVKEIRSEYTIVILTTSASGGNYSVTRAMESFFSPYPAIRTIIVDVETVAEETDPVMLATGATTYDGIYRLFQQEDKGMGPLLERIDLTKRIEKYVPSCFVLKLKELMRELNPDLILSTRSYVPDDISLCTLGIPFRMIHCDYELSFFLIDLYGKIQPEMMKFWIPTLDPPFFRPYFVKEGRLDLYNDQDPSEKIMEKIALISHQPLETIRDQFELIGYPINPAFHRIRNEEKCQNLRIKWGIQSGETPVLISMGKNGVGVLEKIFNELAGSSQTKFKYIFVCGNNLPLKEKLEKKVLDKPQFSIQGLVAPEEMNELMNICPIQISKAGGAITAETLATGIYTLMISSHLWEEANGQQLLKMGIGQQHQETSPLMIQIEECLKKAAAVPPPSTQQNDWQQLLIGRLIEGNNCWDKFRIDP